MDKKRREAERSRLLDPESHQASRDAFNLEKRLGVDDSQFVIVSAEHIAYTTILHLTIYSDMAHIGQKYLLSAYAVSRDYSIEKLMITKVDTFLTYGVGYFITILKNDQDITLHCPSLPNPFDHSYFASLLHV